MKWMPAVPPNKLDCDGGPSGVHTLRELLTHTAGTTVHGFPGYVSGAPVPNTPAIRSEAVPGTSWNYSGGGYTIIQQLLIDVTKEPFSKLLHDTVLAPIGMTRSTYEQPLPQNPRGNAATPYASDGKPVEGGAHTYPELAAAGLWTTPTDVARYAIEVDRSISGNANHVLSPQMTKEMLTSGMGHSTRGRSCRARVCAQGLFADPGISRDHGSANASQRADVMSRSKEPATSRFVQWHVAAASESRVNLPPGLHGQMIS
jgi:CubicO group peptidase (beta-lactamase class C family)